MFRAFDPNGNGYISLAEADKGIRDVLKLDSVFDAKPAIIKAFNAAKSLDTKKQRGKAREIGDAYLEFVEFRMFLVNLHQYFEYLAVFDEIDTSNDRRIDFNEFKRAIPSLARNGVNISAGDAASVFASIDKNGGGFVLFDEFAEWAFSTSLDADPCDED